jgi:EmrB/QacA subfamily drug resistance transporter
MSYTVSPSNLAGGTGSGGHTRTPEDPPVRHGAITAVVCIALAAVTAAMSSLNVAIPDIARSTHATQTQLSWIIDAYSLVFAALLLPAGALGDRFGRRRALLVGLSIFALGSMAAMTASSANSLIALRAVIGLGAALIMPATLSTITGTFPPAQRVKAVSIWAGVAGAAAVVGVLISGALLEFFSWRSVFAVNIVLAAGALIGTVRIVPESADPDAPRLDLAGTCLSIAGLVVLVYSIVEAPTVGWLDVRTLGGIAVGLAVLALFVFVELRRRRPMLDPRIFRRQRLSAGTLSIFVQFFGFYGFIFLILQYLQLVRYDSALVAALSMLPMAVAMMPTSRLAPRLAARMGARRVCAAGLSLIAVAFVVIAQVGRETDYWVLAVGLLVLGAGMGAAMTPATSAITAALPRAQQGVASAMNDLARELGGALGIAVLGSIAAATYRTQLDVSSLPTAEADAVRDSFAVAAHLGGPVGVSAEAAFVDGVHLALHVAAAVTLVAALAVAALLPRHGDAAPASGEGATA